MKALTLEQKRNLLGSALEGGSNYWYRIDEFIAPKPEDLVTDPFFDDGEVFRHIDYPCSKGGALVITCHADDENEEVNGQVAWTLDLAAMRRGAQVMHDKYPTHYGNVLRENDDAETGDVFLQCCLFGEVVFG